MHLFIFWSNIVWFVAKDNCFYIYILLSYPNNNFFSHSLGEKAYLFLDDVLPINRPFDILQIYQNLFYDSYRIFSV